MMVTGHSPTLPILIIRSLPGRATALESDLNPKPLAR